MQETRSNTDPRRGWFKILIHDFQEVFHGLFWSEELDIEPLPFIYGRLDPEQVSFDCALSIPFLAVDRVVFVRSDERPEARQPVASGEIGFPMQMIPLKLLAVDQENRCYIPAEVVTCIIPVDTRHPIVAALVQVTSESGLIIPSISDAGPVGPGEIIDMTGQRLDIPQKGNDGAS